MDLHSMKRTKKEKKTTGGAEAVEPMDDDYPYGLEISLEKESLEKLGMDIDNFTIGGTVDMISRLEVTRLHESASKRDTNAGVSLQITDMAMKERPSKKSKKLKDVLDVLKGED